MGHIDREFATHGRNRSPRAIKIQGYRCTVATDAAVAGDDVYVTLDNDNQPKQRMLVDWKPRISESGSLARVFPQRGMKGTLIFTDVGKPWLLW
jgi:hypothetical protein